MSLSKQTVLQLIQQLVPRFQSPLLLGLLPTGMNNHSVFNPEMQLDLYSSQ